MLEFLEFIGGICDIIVGVANFTTRDTSKKYSDLQTTRACVIAGSIIGVLVIAISPFFWFDGERKTAVAESIAGAIVLGGCLLHIPRWRRLARLEVPPRKHCTQCKTSTEGNTTGACLNCGAPIVRVKSKTLSDRS